MSWMSFENNFSDLHESVSSKNQEKPLLVYKNIPSTSGDKLNTISKESTQTSTNSSVKLFIQKPKFEQLLQKNLPAMKDSSLVTVRRSDSIASPTRCQTTNQIIDHCADESNLNGTLYSVISKNQISHQERVHQLLSLNYRENTEIPVNMYVASMNRISLNKSTNLMPAVKRTNTKATTNSHAKKQVRFCPNSIVFTYSSD